MSERILDSGKVYSSYYKRGNLDFNQCVSISLGKPKNLKDLLPDYPQLHPTTEIFELYKAKKITEEEFSKRYKSEVLDKLNPRQVYVDLRGKVLLCHEKDDEFCHRHLVLAWISEAFPDHDIIGGEL